MKLKQAITGAAALACLTTAAHAQTAGSFYVTTGWFHLSPQSSSDPLEILSTGGTPVNQSVAGTGASVSDSDTLGLSLGYNITDHLATEFEFGIPPKFDLQGAGTIAPYGNLGTARQWSPALLFKWNFLSPQAKLRPYVGLGVTRVWFTDPTITNTQFEASVLHGGPTSVSTDSSWAPVFNLGFNYNITDHWFAGVSISYIPVSVKANFTTTNVGPTKVTVNSQAKIRLDPIVTYAKIGYRF
jgi:outer membrane protein